MVWWEWGCVDFQITIFSWKTTKLGRQTGQMWNHKVHVRTPYIKKICQILKIEHITCNIFTPLFVSTKSQSCHDFQLKITIVFTQLPGKFDFGIIINRNLQHKWGKILFQLFFFLIKKFKIKKVSPLFYINFENW